MKEITERLDWIEAYLREPTDDMPTDDMKEAAWEAVREIRAIAEVLPEQQAQIAKLQLAPDDIIVLKVHARLDPETADRIRGRFEDFVRNKVIVLDDGAEISVLAAGTPNEQRAARGRAPIITLPPT